MATIPVMNPPKRRKKFKRKKSRPVKKRRVRVHRVRRKKIVRHVRRRKIKAVKNTPKRKIRRRRKSRKHFNPFGSELIMMGNPYKKSRRKKYMARHKRRHRKRHALRNPLSPSALLSKPKEMISKEYVTEAVSVAAGFIAPNIVMGYLPVGFRDSKVKFYASKVLTIAGLSAVSGMVSKKASRFVLIGGGVSLLLDLWAEFKARSVAPSGGTSAYYGNMGAYYGDNMGDDIVLSEEPEAAF